MSKKVSLKDIEKSVESVLFKIAKRRQELGISQTDLAMKLNMTISGYFKVEKGESKLDIFRLLEIAKHLEIDVKELF